MVRRSINMIRHQLSYSAFVTGVATIALAMMISPSWANVTGEGDVTPDDLPIGGGTASGDVIVGDSTITTDPDLDTHVGRLTIDAPAFTDPLESPNGFIGRGQFGIGTVTVAGFDLDQSRWNVDTLLTVGEGGQGYLNVIDGGRVKVGDDTVMPPMFDTGDIIVGDQLFAQGIVNASGFASVIETKNLTIGNFGFATLDLSNQAFMRNETTIIGNEPESIGRATLTGLGTRWINSESNADDFVVAEEGRGTLEVFDGAMLLNINDVSVARLAGSRGVVNMSGQDTLWQIDDSTGGGEDLDIGPVGDAEFNISDTALLRVSGDISLGDTSFINLASGGIINASDITIDGVIRGDGRIESDMTINGSGELRNKAHLNDIREYLYVTGNVLNGGTIESIGGEMEFESPVLSSFEIIARDAIMRFTSGLTNDGSLSLGGNTMIHGDITGVGNIHVMSNSAVTIVGDLTFTAANILSLTVGDSPGTLDVVGAADMTGALIDLNYSAGIMSQPGDSYQIFQATDGITGYVPGVAVADGFIWNITQSGNALIATRTGAAAAPMTTDLNGDGVVNGLDVAIWEDNFPTFGGTPPVPGDTDGDGDVDGIDFLRIQSDFGGAPSPAVAAATAAVVPEPASALLMVFGSLLIGAGSRSRSRR